MSMYLNPELADDVIDALANFALSRKFAKDRVGETLVREVIARVKATEAHTAYDLRKQIAALQRELEAKEQQEAFARISGNEALCLTAGELLRQGRIVDAIKAIRLETGLELAPAKMAAMALAAR